jgi:hypothetical protein
MLLDLSVKGLFGMARGLIVTAFASSATQTWGHSEYHPSEFHEIKK